MSRFTRLRSFILATVGLVAIAGIPPAVADDAPTWSDPTYFLQQPLDLLSFWLSPENAGGAAIDHSGNAYFMPDWNGNGTYGDQGDFTADDQLTDASAPFRYPCLATDGSVTYQLTDGTCAPGDTPGANFALGRAIRTSFVAANGNRLSVTLIAPHSAVDGGTSKHPGMVFANGGWAPGRMYYLYSMTAARSGYITMHFDFSGTGGSGGSVNGIFSGPDAGPCTLRRMCREMQDAVRWFVGAPITPFVTEGTGNPAYQPAGDNVPNPLVSRLDTGKVAVAGQSGGGHVASNYPWYQATGKGIDGQPLPAIKAAVLLSGFGKTKAVVPIQAQTADLDLPFGTAPVEPLNHTNGPVGTKKWYDELRTSMSGNGPLSLIVMESGSHGDTTGLPLLPRVAWSQALSTSYAISFLDCYLKGSASGCQNSVAPQQHLSRAVASEYDPDGPAGWSPSRCITVPDAASLGLLADFKAFFLAVTGHPAYDCVP